MVSIEQDFRRAEACELGWAGVVGVIQEPAGAVLRAGNAVCVAGNLGIRDPEALEFARGLVAERTGNKPGDGVDNNSGSKLTSAQNVVADGKLHIAVELIDALVDTFISPAEQNKAIDSSEFARQCLGEGAALRGKEDHPRWDGWRLRALSFRQDAQGREGFGQGLGFQNHAFSPTERTVVDGAMPVVGEVAQIVNADHDQFLSQRAAQDAVLKDAGEECREYGDDLKAHTLR